MLDHVTYDIGFGPLGDLINKIWIGRRLIEIFNFRAQKIEVLYATHLEGG